MVAIHRHFQSVAEEIRETSPLSTVSICEPLVVVPIDRWSKITEKGLRFALSLSKEIKVVHILFDEKRDELGESWSKLVEQPAESGRITGPGVDLPAVSFSICRHSNRRLRSRSERQKSGPRNHRDCSRTGRAQVVSLFPSQPARPGDESSASPERQPADHHGEYSVVFDAITT